MPSPPQPRRFGRMVIGVDIYVFIGGATSFWGPVIGAIGVTLILEEVSALEDYQTTVFGIIVILIMLFSRGGLVSLPETLMHRGKQIMTLTRRKRAGGI